MRRNRSAAERACRTCPLPGTCAANHIAVAIPGDRVVRSIGTLSGCRWSVERKRHPLDTKSVA